MRIDIRPFLPYFN